jgi:four helix bundle protein
MMADARKLSVYGKAVALADEIRLVVRSWESLDRWTVGVQLIRAADSVGANLSEGLGRAGDRDQMRFLVISRGSAAETEYWLERATARNLDGVSSMPDRAREVSRMLNGLIASRRC